MTLAIKYISLSKKYSLQKWTHLVTVYNSCTPKIWRKTEKKGVRYTWKITVSVSRAVLLFVLLIIHRGSISIEKQQFFSITIISNFKCDTQHNSSEHDRSQTRKCRNRNLTYLERNWRWLQEDVVVNQEVHSVPESIVDGWLKDEQKLSDYVYTVDLKWIVMRKAIIFIQSLYHNRVIESIRGINAH